MLLNLSFRKDVDHVGHQCDVLALAINTNGDIVASGDETGKIILWDEHLHHIHQFTEHKKSVTGENKFTIDY